MRRFIDMETTKVSTVVTGIGRYIQPAKVENGKFFPKVTFFKMFLQDSIPMMKAGNTVPTKLIYIQTTKLVMDIVSVTGVNLGVADILEALPLSNITLELDNVETKKGIYTNVSVAAIKLHESKREEVEFLMTKPYLSDKERVAAAKELGARKAASLFADEAAAPVDDKVAALKQRLADAEAALAAEVTPANKAKVTKAKKALAAVAE